MTELSKQKDLFSKYGWVFGITLLLATLCIQLVFWQVVPTFLELFDDFGTDTSRINIYHGVTSIIMIVGESLLLLTIVLHFLLKNSFLRKATIGFYTIYAILLAVIFFGMIFVLYSNVFVFGEVIN